MDGYEAFEVVMEVELAHLSGSSDGTMAPRQVRKAVWNVASLYLTLAGGRWKDRARGVGA